MRRDLLPLLSSADPMDSDADAPGGLRVRTVWISDLHLGTPGCQATPLLDFLKDEKEIYELFMVVDEELKMMCDLCHEGGQVLGPFLKPMTHLIHTEYLLAGRTDRDVREVLRDTMYAATVTGSPVENACRLIKAYESEGRGYYGAALAILLVPILALALSPVEAVLVGNGLSVLIGLSEIRILVRKAERSAWMIGALCVIATPAGLMALAATATVAPGATHHQRLVACSACPAPAASPAQTAAPLEAPPHCCRA